MHSNIEHRNTYHGVQPQPSPQWESAQVKCVHVVWRQTGTEHHTPRLSTRPIQHWELVFSVLCVVEAVTETMSFSEGRGCLTIWYREWLLSRDYLEITAHDPRLRSAASFGGWGLMRHLWHTPSHSLMHTPQEKVHFNSWYKNRLAHSFDTVRVSFKSFPPTSAILFPPLL